jgi:Fur family transcriptional regulator, ferric uptake regulator
MTVTVPAERIYTLLKEAGYRLTSPRRAVAHVLLSALTPLSIEEIHGCLGSRAINRVSIYRTIQLLCDLGVVRRLQFQEGFARYELADTFGSHHHHFVCNLCGKVEDIDACPLAATEQAIIHRTHSRITSHSLEFYGVCGACALGALSGHGGARLDETRADYRR